MFKELTPDKVYRALAETENSLLIDCRTRAEWVYVGIPDLGQTKGQLALIEWVDITGQQNVNFAAQCQEQAGRLQQDAICVVQHLVFWVLVVWDASLPIWQKLSV